MTKIIITTLFGIATISALFAGAHGMAALWGINAALAVAIEI